MDNTGAENHCTILTISESPLKPGSFGSERMTAKSR